MLQILQSLENGDTTLAKIPCPRVGNGQLLICTLRSLVSAGTERMLVDFSKANLNGAVGVGPFQPADFHI